MLGRPRERLRYVIPGLPGNSPGHDGEDRVVDVVIGGMDQAVNMLDEGRMKDDPVKGKGEYDASQITRGI